jgi:archaellum component FlaC
MTKKNEELEEWHQGVLEKFEKLFAEWQKLPRDKNGQKQIPGELREKLEELAQAMTDIGMTYEQIWEYIDAKVDEKKRG